MQRAATAVRAVARAIAVAMAAASATAIAAMMAVIAVMAMARDGCVEGNMAVLREIASGMQRRQRRRPWR